MKAIQFRPNADEQMYKNSGEKISGVNEPLNTGTIEFSN
jgi:hypothetical protein